MPGTFKGKPVGEKVPKEEPKQPTAEELEEINKNQMEAKRKAWSK